MNSNFEKIIKSYLLPKDDYIYGLADMGNLFNTVFGIHRYAIVIGRKLNYAIISGISEYSFVGYSEISPLCC